MYKLAIIGDDDSVLAFKAVGIDTYITSTKEAEKVLKRHHKSKKYAVILITEPVANATSDLLKEYEKMPFPAVVILPVGQVKQDIGYKTMRETCIKATGTDILPKL